MVNLCRTLAEKVKLVLGGLAFFIYGMAIPIIMGQNIGTCATATMP